MPQPVINSVRGQKHRSNLMSKLDVHNAARLTAFAIEKGLLVR